MNERGISFGRSDGGGSAAMVATPGLQRGWKVVPGNDGWTFEAFDCRPSLPAEPPPSEDPPRLPSMADLLLQASPAIFRDDSGCGAIGVGSNDGGSGQMFRTGSGKPVAVKESSIRRALAVLGEGETRFAGGQACCSNSDAPSCFSNSLFLSGSGRTIQISSASLNRASNLLLSENNQSVCYYQGCQPNVNNNCDSEHYVWDGGGDLEDKHVWNAGKATMCNTKPSFVVSGRKRRLTGPACVYSLERQSEAGTYANTMDCRMKDFVAKEPPIKFQTAGGRSISVSEDALKRAMNLLGGSEFGMLSCEANSGDSVCSSESKNFNLVSCNKENIPFIHSLKPNSTASEGLAEKVQSHFGIPTQTNLFKPASLNFNSSGGVREWVDRSDYVCRPIQRVTRSLLRDTFCLKDSPVNAPMREKLRVEDGSPRELPNGSLTDISNHNYGVFPFRSASASSAQPFANGERRRLGRRSSISSFKQPRRTRFFPPLLNGFPGKDTQTESALLHPHVNATKRRISICFPFQHKRRCWLEFFQLPPHHCKLAENLPDEVKHMNAETAACFIFNAESGSSKIGSDVLWNMLIESGASPVDCTKEWAVNHYKWIVWKFASLERCYPAQAGGKFLTVANVLEELKYRYEREVNHGHRSAIKKILEGDALCSSMMILCISAIRYCPIEKDESLGRTKDKTKDIPSSSTSIDDLGNAVKCEVAKIELTDGWYSVNAVLDVPLSKQLALGKLFIGQKLRVWGASLSGWVAPVGPLEAGGDVALVLHINGTYRTHWAEPLGFCKGYRAPLSFRCIKVNGGPVLRTLVGITRLYPLLYKERLQQGGSIVRSERMETKMLQIYKQRCTILAEGVISELHTENFGSSVVTENEGEGAKIFKLLETAAEPEMLMATLTPQQLVSYKNYQAKQEERCKSEIKKRVEMALNVAGLNSREVRPFLRVQVVSITPRNSEHRRLCRRGLITIWEPTEKQLLDLEEGQIYSVTGLVPVSLDNDIIHLHTRGSRTKWVPLPLSASENFEPFFRPRASISLSNMGKVPISSEFDIAGVIVYVGELYLSGKHKKQWVFLTDGSTSDSINSNSLLAISFSLPVMDAESCAPVHSALTGSTVLFCNLVKRVRDQANQLWVAEATENSTYSFSCRFPGLSHLKEAADSVSKWSRKSSLTIEKLRERVLGIIGV